MSDRIIEERQEFLERRDRDALAVRDADSTVLIPAVVMDFIKYGGQPNKWSGMTDRQLDELYGWCHRMARLAENQMNMRTGHVYRGDR